eukprot:NODE_629_length_5211_cov_0.605243.p5 type:complete len:113 gc:universal NODE_629_length_5211_cov_0.605243:808-470(-)
MIRNSKKRTSKRKEIIKILCIDLLHKRIMFDNSISTTTQQRLPDAIEVAHRLVIFFTVRCKFLNTLATGQVPYPNTSIMASGYARTTIKNQARYAISVCNDTSHWIFLLWIN